MPWFWFLNTWVISASDCRLVALSLYATGWRVFSKCMQLTLVSWYLTSMLCCHCWMFSLSDALPMQSMGTLSVRPCDTTYLFSILPIYVATWNRWYIMAITLWRCWLHSCRMFSLLVEYGLMHRGDCINCETWYSCLIRLLYGRVLGVQTFTLLSL